MIQLFIILFNKMPQRASLPVSQEWDTVVLNKKQTSNVPKCPTSNKKQFNLENATEPNSIELLPRNIIVQLVAARVAQKLSQKDLANRLNLDIKTIQKIESFKHEKNMALAQKIAKCLKISLVK